VKRSLFISFLILAAVLVGWNLSPAGDANNSSTPEVSTNASPVNLAAEIARAKTENKLLLMEFGSSDSCPPCIIFQQEVFSKPEFLAYEKSNLDFVRLDYPQRTALPAAIQVTNIILAQQFEAYMFPTFVALDRDGKEFWRMPQKGQLTLETRLFQPKEFIALLESVRKMEK
jgi:thioredoxin-related protein